jgi:hypothetical protein
MFNRDDLKFAGYLIAGYLAFVEVLSWETSKWPACLVVSKYQSADNQSGYQTCATFHEGIMRGAGLLCGFFTHDNVTAAATVIIAVFTLTLWLANERLGGIVRRQTEIQEKQFVATHRPKLIVRHVLLDADVSEIQTVILLGHGGDAFGGLSVVNVGGSDARIVRAVYRIHFQQGELPARSPLMDGVHVLIEPDTVIERGGSRFIQIWGRVDFGAPYDNSPRDIREFENAGWTAYVLGEISYTDDGGAYHYMGFCRQRQSNGRFLAVTDPDNEYED